MNQSGIDDRALTQRQAAIAQIATDHTENSRCQVVLFYQEPEIENGGFVRDSPKAQARKLAKNGRLIQRLFHRRIALAEPALHQMYPQHRHQWVGRTTTFTLWIMRLDQSNQTLPGHLILLDQE